MATCAECTDLLLDYLYGLLDDAEAQSLRDHLAGCPACQQSLEKAKRQQELFARAARKFTEVPPFQPPADEPAILPIHAVGGPIASPPLSNPATLSVPSRSRRSWRRWLPAAVAASVLLAAGTLYGGYRQGLESRTKDLAASKKAVDTIDALLASLARTFEAQQASLTARVQGQFLNVQVIGPATVQPGAPTSYRLSTQAPNGQPTPAKVSVKLVNPGAEQEGVKQVLWSREYQTNGELRFLLPGQPAAQLGSEPRLLIEAAAGQAKEILEQTLAVEQPTFVTHLALNKTTLQGGDFLFFRTATLDRFTLKPIDRPLTMDFTLYRTIGGKVGAKVKQIQSVAEQGGVAWGMFPLANDTTPLTPGDYLLIASETSPAKNKTSNVRAASRVLHIEAAAAADQALDGKAKEQAAAKASPPGPVAATSVKAEFFPEGGDLVGGTLNRVYFRIHFPQGVPASLQGVVEDSKQQPVLKVAFDEDGRSPGTDRKLALGTFTFTPQFGQLYRFRLSAGDTPIDGYPLPSVLPTGINMTVPESVLPPDQPIKVQVRGAMRQPLLVMATCRGRTVDQKIIPSADAMSNVTLEPQPGSSGIMRVTVYEKDGDGWRPAAERLVYRRPAEYLELSAAFPAAPAKGYQPANKVEMRIDSLNESKQPTAAWLNALVIDEKVLHAGDQPQASPPAYFLLNSDLRDPEDLEDADFFLADTAPAAKAFDLFLGTQGWRRFLLQPAASAPVRLEVRPSQQKAAVPLLFSAGTDKTAVLEKFARTVAQEQSVIARDAGLEQQELLTDRDRALAAAESASAALAKFEERPMTWLRLGIGLTVFVLIAVGAGMLLIGLIVAFRAKSSPRLMLASSFATLLLAIIIFASTGSLRMAGDSTDAGLAYAWLPPAPLKLPDGFFQPQQNLGKEAGQPGISSQLFAAAAPKQPEMALGGKGGGAKKGGGKGAGGGGFGGAPPGAAGGAGVAAAFNKGLPDGVKLPMRDIARDDKSNQNLRGGGTVDQGKLPPAQFSQNYANQFPALSNAQGNIANTANNAIRQYAYNNTPPALDHDGMVFWDALLPAPDGKAQVSFDLHGQATTYRILIYGHTADGRLGVYQGKLPVGSGQ